MYAHKHKYMYPVCMNAPNHSLTHLLNKSINQSISHIQAAVYINTYTYTHLLMQTQTHTF